MNKQEFLKLLDKAKVDKNGNLYFIGDKEIKNRVYFATVTTICDDFTKEYCSEYKGEFEYYNRHFTYNDDTIEIKVINNKEQNQ